MVEKRSFLFALRPWDLKIRKNKICRDRRPRLSVPAHDLLTVLIVAARRSMHSLLRLLEERCLATFLGSRIVVCRRLDASLTLGSAHSLLCGVYDLRDIASRPSIHIVVAYRLRKPWLCRLLVRWTSFGKNSYQLFLPCYPTTPSMPPAVALEAVE